MALSQLFLLLTSFLLAADPGTDFGVWGLVPSSRQEAGEDLALSPFSVAAAAGRQDPEDVPGWEDQGGPQLTQGNWVMCCLGLTNTNSRTFHFFRVLSSQSREVFPCPWQAKR